MKKVRVCLLAVAALCAGQASARPGAPPRNCAPIPEEKIAYQLYNLTRVLQAGQAPGQPLKVSIARLSENLAAMRAAGFHHFERFGDTLGEAVPDYAATARRSGQTVIGSQGTLDPAQWEAAMDAAVALGQTEIGAAGFGAPGIDTLAHTLLTAARLNALGKRAAARGLRLYVHNHTQELTTKFPYDLGKTGTVRPVSAWKIVAATTDPRYVHFEIDVHWASVAFGVRNTGALLAFLRKYHDRIDLLHVKDTAADGKITDLGAGVTDWPAVFRAAGSGIRHYIWEYDNVPDVFRSAAIAHRFLRCGQ
jgi:sugar phosphate isomerase/epimerase